MLKLYNTLARRLEPFTPINPPNVGLYTCGPTVYSSPHIGNFRAYIFADVLRRTLLFNNYTVTQVMNVTDVGHLTSDADEGEDKLEKGARAEGLSVWDVAKKYTAEFLDGLRQLNILEPTTLVKATEHVPDMIKCIQQLEGRGFTYETDQALYFDVTKFSTYTALSKQALGEKKVAVRPEVVTDPGKRHAADFALWFKRVGKFAHHTMHWDSPWGVGFPGWHIECSAMSMKYLGDQFDIHTGGIDHIPVHHTNEIAQSEGATGKSPFVKYWLHSEFLVAPTGKMAKSEGHIYTLKDLAAKRTSPLAFRYLVLQTHYRSPLTFTWDALERAAHGLNRLWTTIDRTESEARKHRGVGCAEFEQRFRDAINDDLNTPQAIALMHDMLGSDYPWHAKRQSLSVFDRVLGLDLLEKSTRPKLPPLNQAAQTKIDELMAEREQSRREKNWTRADDLRRQINDLLQPFDRVLDDTDEGPLIRPR